MKISPPFRTIKPFILASSSPRREKMLTKLGIDCDISPACTDETPIPGEEPDPFARRMALAKASEIAALNPHAWVLGADTVVSIGGRILGKPRDRNDALAILKLLVGRTHQVITGVSLCHRALGFEETFADLSLVTFAQFPDDILSAYVRTGEPLDKAGAYGIQGIGSFLARSVNGSCTNVIGLPIDSVVSVLLSRGVIEFRA